MANNDADDTLTAVARLLPDADIAATEPIRGSERSAVLRVRAGGPGWDGPETLIIKRFSEAGEGWARESSALSSLPGGLPAPRLVASGPEPPLVVMTDAGAGPSVANALLSGTPEEAMAALDGYVDALAAFHLGTLGLREIFRSRLAASSGGSAPETTAPRFVARAAADLGQWCDRLGVPVPDGALETLTGLPDRISASGPSALTPADTCPDNNVRTDDGGYCLIDFEGAQWRPVAWDVAYLTVPWPSCWCSFRFPEAVSDRAVARYRSAVAERLPYVATEAFGADVAAVTTAWALVSPFWLLRTALEDDPPLHSEIPGTPTRRAVLLHRLADARDLSAIPILAELADRLRTELVRRWGEVPLAYAPAFRVR